MAFALSLFALPGLFYGFNEASNTIESIVNFDYKKYFENKINNLDKNTQIKLLEYDNSQKSYKSYTDKYKKCILNNKETIITN